jgi:hemolysin-activating ACP:hemolysin acyltransferase
MSAISITQLSDSNAATGLAAAYLAATSTFGAYRADRLIGSILGQIERRHYAFAVRDNRIVGYAGWALCAARVAEAWLRDGKAPSADQCREGDVLVLVLFAAEDRQVSIRLTRYLRDLYAGKEFMARRASSLGGHIQRGRVPKINPERSKRS